MEPSCGTCTREITGQYFKAGDRVLCDACRHRYELELADRPALGHFLRAGVLGLLAALVGAALWGGVIWLTGYELGLIAVVVGLSVGAAVKVGSGGLGGRGYQLMAVALTYLAVSLAYVPLILSGMAGSFGELELAGVPSVLGLAAAVPFLGGFENAIGLLIIGFALFEAWRMNQAVDLSVGGPYDQGG